MPVCSAFHSFPFNTVSSHSHSSSPHSEDPISSSWPPEDCNFKHHHLIGCPSSEYWTMEIKLHYVFQKEKHGSKPEQEKIKTSILKMRHERERGLKKDTTFCMLWPGQLGTILLGTLRRWWRVILVCYMRVGKAEYLSLNSHWLLLRADPRTLICSPSTVYVPKITSLGLL